MIIQEYHPTGLNNIISWQQTNRKSLFALKNIYASIFSRFLKGILKLSQSSFYIVFMMKKILSIVQTFLRKYPTPSKITRMGNLFKLNYTYSSPFTDSRNTKQVLLPFKQISSGSLLTNPKKTLVYDQKGRIEESQSFDSILVKEKHEKVIQDHTFGQAVHTKDYTKWAYTASVKSEPTKSYFSQGKGKLPYRHDFGEGYQGVTETGIFLWDKTNKSVQRIDIPKDLIPAHVSFANEEGSQIIFHAYKKQNFGHGILHCLNRPVSIYQASIKYPQPYKHNQKCQAPQISKVASKQQKDKDKLDVKIQQLLKDHHQTNMFASISPCFNYLVYLSGSGIIHAYYLDLVVAKRQGGKWVQTHRHKEIVCGFYDALKNYIVEPQQGKPYAIFQTYKGASTHIMKIDLESGHIKTLTDHFKETHDFAIDGVEPSGLITGTVNSNNYNTFFYTQGDSIQLVPPPEQQDFQTLEYRDPIPAMLVQTPVLPEDYSDRVQSRPLVIMLHGGPHASYSPVLTCFRYALLKMGYAILMPNIPGSMGYGQQYIHGQVGGIGSKDVKPLLQLIDKVLNDQKNIDRSKVHLYGGSYGGYLGALLGSRYADKFRSAVILNGALNNAAMMWFTDIPEWITAQTLGKSALHSLTREDYTQMWEQSATREPMKIPTLQFMGAKDRRVPYRQGLFFDAITKTNGTPITTYVYENSSHGLADSVETSIDIVVKSLLFLQGELSGQSSSVQK